MSDEAATRASTPTPTPTPTPTAHPVTAAGLVPAPPAGRVPGRGASDLRLGWPLALVVFGALCVGFGLGLLTTRFLHGPAAPSSADAKPVVAVVAGGITAEDARTAAAVARVLTSSLQLRVLDSSLIPPQGTEAIVNRQTCLALGAELIVTVARNFNNNGMPVEIRVTEAKTGVLLATGALSGSDDSQYLQFVHVAAEKMRR